MASARFSHLMKTVKAPLIQWRDRRRFADVNGASSKWPIARRNVPADRRPFFVVGFPRSGSTLLRAILSEHPDLFIPRKTAR